MQNSASAQTLSAQVFPSSQPHQNQVFPGHPATGHPASGHPVVGHLPASPVLTGAAQATDQAEVFALLHTLLQAFNDLQMRIGQLEHTEHVRAALRPRRDLGIDY